ncbi:MAG TPA: hypothetical protein VKU77_04730 [Streptosporangiaceae bacterium]|nr:hypothetical protein [Streptosporangiaceae bacterium]
MSYEPSHRKPPRQERWPNATPGEGWPAYQEHGDGEQSWASADALAGTRNGYATASNGAAFGGRADAWGGRTATAEYGGTWDGRGARYDEPAGGYRAARNGYGTTTTARPAAGDGYADGFDGAADGYDPGGYGAADGYSPGGYGSGGYATDGYASGGYAADGYAAERYGADRYGSGGYAADGYAADEYGQAQDHSRAERGWDGYAQPGHEFTAPVGYQEQDEYPALEPGTSAVLVAPDTLGEWWRRPAGTGRELSRGLIVGALMGILAAAVAIGVATFAAAFVRPQASPASVLGNIFVNRIPAALKHSVMTHFGAHARTVLLLGMYIALGLIAMVLGCTARRNPSVGVAGIASFGLLAAFIVITRPESRASDVIPSAVGAVAGMMALLWLARASAPGAEPQPAYSSGRRRTR